MVWETVVNEICYFRRIEGQYEFLRWGGFGVGDGVEMAEMVSDCV